MGLGHERRSVGDGRGGRTPHGRLAAAAAAAAVAVGIGTSAARGSVWVTPGSGTWTNVANWNPNIPDGVDAVADFSQVDLTADATVALGTAHTVGTLIFGDTDPSTPGGWLLSDTTQQTLTLATSAGDATINVGPLGTGKAATIASLVKVAAGQVVDKTGSGTLIFTNAGNAAATGFAGILDIQAGVFQVGATTALPNFDPTTIRIDGGTMRFSASANTGRIFTIGAAGGTLDEAVGSALSGTGPTLFTGTGARTLTVNIETGTASIASLIGDAAAGSPTSITKVGTGSLTLSNAASVFTGNLTVSAGNLSTTTLGGGNVSVATGSTLTLSRTTSQTFAGSFTGGGNFVQTGGTGTVNLANASYTGSTTVQNGTFVVNPSSTSNYVLGTAGAYFTFGILSLNADFTAPVGTTGGGLTFAGNGAGGGFVNLTAGTRAVNLGGAGATLTLNSGGFYAGSTGANGSATDARFKFGDLNGTALGTVDFQNGINLNGRLFKTVTDGSAQFAAVLSGNVTGTGDATTGAITKFGNGNLALTGSNTYTGATTIGGTGAIVLGSANAFSPNTNVVLGGGNATTNAGVLGLGAYGDLAANLGTAGGTVGFVAGNSGGFAAFGGDRQVTLSGGATLAWGSTASFVATGQNLILSLPSADGRLTFNNPVDTNGAARTVVVNKGTGTTVDAALPGVISDSLGTNGGLVKVGAGVLVLSGANTYGGGTNISGGTVVATNAAAFGPASNTTGVAVNGGARLVLGGLAAPTATVALPQNVTFSAGGTLQLAPTPNFSSGGVTGVTVAGSGVVALTIGANPADGVTHGLLTTGSVNFASAGNASGGSLDVGRNDLDITGQTVSTVTALVASAFNGGAWNGPGIASSAAASDPKHLTALGVIANDNGSGPIYGGGGAGSPTFDGSSPGATDTLVKFTYYGDTNLDGVVNAADYTRIDAGFVNHLTGWFNGDLNYDGVVDGSDYALMDNAFNQQPGAIPSLVAAPATSLAGGAVAVPEPTTSAVAAAGVAALLGVRRRRRLPSP